MPRAQELLQYMYNQNPIQVTGIVLLNVQWFLSYWTLSREAILWIRPQIFAANTTNEFIFPPQQMPPL